MKNLFKVIEMDETLIQDVIQKSEDIHYHDFEEIIIATEGSMQHFIDFQSELAEAPFVCYVPYGKLHKVVPSAHLRGWIINFQSNFIPESNLNFYSNFTSSTQYPIASDTCIYQYDGLCRLLFNESNRKEPDLQTLRFLSAALTAMIESERRKLINVSTENKNTTMISFNSFLKILEQNYHRDIEVGFYAEKLNMTERNLNIITKKCIQKNVSEIIETRRLIEARRLLFDSNLSISEIGYQLGYSEKSYFTRIFKSKTGMTPKEFRQKAHLYLS